MVRWYKGFDCTNITPQALVEQVAGIVRRNRLGSTLPVVRYEKRTGRTRMFYFFMAIESEREDLIPESIRSTLLQLPSFRRPLPGGFQLEQIRSMVSAELDVQDYARRLNYRSSLENDDFDPFVTNEAAEGSVGAQLDRAIENTHKYDRLLIWLTSMGAGSRNVFQRACVTLGLDKDGVQSSRILRRLRLLGHVELSRDGKRWSIAPSVLVRSPGTIESPVEYVVCGRRSLQLISKLRSISNIAEIPQEQGDGPSTLLLSAGSDSTLWEGIKQLNLGADLHDGGNVAVRLAGMLPTMGRWIQTLDAVPGVSPAMYSTRRYSGGEFVECNFKGQDGFYQLWPIISSGKENTPKLQLFFDAASDRWVRGDWYGLRFAAQQTAGEGSPVKYYREYHRLAIPFSSRWPELYERTLTLASGRLPVFNGPWLIYEGVTPQLLEELERKISLERIEKDNYA